MCSPIDLASGAWNMRKSLSEHSIKWNIRANSSTPTLWWAAVSFRFVEHTMFVMCRCSEAGTTQDSLQPCATVHCWLCHHLFAVDCVDLTALQGMELGWRLEFLGWITDKIAPLSFSYKNAQKKCWEQMHLLAQADASNRNHLPHCWHIKFNNMLNNNSKHCQQRHVLCRC